MIWYIATVLLGLVIHLFGTYSVSVKILGKENPIKFFRGIKEAQIIAFTTSSSAATLPVNIECMEKNLGVPKQIANFVLPLGATVNMDGTALYQAVAAVFIAQIYGVEIGIAQQLTIVLIATSASVGTAPVPGAGIIMLAIILKSISVPEEGIALILGVDRFLDMCRTVVNVTGDGTAALFIARKTRNN
jgi:Na+/H+-dicarboxylate symporter